MSLFLLTFFACYGGAHLYSLLKARAALALGSGAALAAALPLAALSGAPLIVHYLARADHEDAARTAAWIGYTWMGLLFCFLWINLALDAANLAARAANLLRGRGALPALRYTRPVFLATAGLAAALAGYGMLEARAIRTEYLRVLTDKLPHGVSRVRVAQISDLHLGLVVRHGAARKVVRILAENRPDIVVATGDIVDGQINHLEGLAETFAAVCPPLGKYAVLGNHEFYAGVRQSLEFLGRAGFSVLRGRAELPGGVVRIAGVDDETAARFGTPVRSAAAALDGRPPALYTILLKHRPRVESEAEALFDLQLSGHTHGGQIFPFQFVVGRFFPRLRGLFPLGEGRLLRVSRGTGTWGPPMRVLAPPEVTIIDIERKPARL